MRWIFFFFRVDIKKKSLATESKSISSVFPLETEWPLSISFLFCCSAEKILNFFFIFGGKFSDFPLLPLSHRARRSPLIQSEYKTVFFSCLSVLIFTVKYKKIFVNKNKQFFAASPSIGLVNRWENSENSHQHIASFPSEFSLFFSPSFWWMCRWMRSSLDHLREFVQAFLFSIFICDKPARARVNFSPCVIFKEDLTFPTDILFTRICNPHHHHSRCYIICASLALVK